MQIIHLNDAKCTYMFLTLLETFNAVAYPLHSYDTPSSASMTLASPECTPPPLTVFQFFFAVSVSSV